MIPKLLTIKGLYSYQTEQVIDFEELSKDNLFGIFGNVGAGKSSILEAIMLALYFEVERIGKSGRNYNIMNLRSDDLRIVFDFEVDGKQYRSQVTGRRNSKKFGDVKLESPNFYEKFEGEFKPIDIKTAEPLIGLKAEDFKKTIIIPQGTFQDFLQLGDTERTRMMSELFGLERYDLEPKVKFLIHQNEATIQGLNGQLTQIGDIKLENIDTKKEQLSDLNTLIYKQKIELDEKRKTETALAQLKVDFEQYQKVQTRKEALTKQEGHFLSLQKQLDNYEKAFSTFKNLFDNRQKLAINLSKNRVELALKQENFTKNQTKLNELNLTRQNLTPQYEGRENLKKQAEEARKLIDIKKAQSVSAEIEDRISKGLLLTNSTVENLEKEKNKAAHIQLQLNEFRKNKPDWSVLNAVKNWFTIDYNFKNNITQLNAEDKFLSEKLDAMRQIKKVIVVGHLPPLNVHLATETPISEVIAALKSKITALKTAIETLQHEQMHLKASEKLESLAAALQEGDACPLCGATHHPTVMQIGEVRSTLKELESRLVQNKKEIKSLENIESELFTLNISFKNEAEAQQKLNIKMGEEKEKLQAHFQQFQWSDFSPTDEKEVENAIKIASDFDNQIEKLEKSQALVNKNKEDAENKITTYRKLLSDYETQKATQESTIHILKTQIAVLDFENEVTKSEQQLVELTKSLEKQYITIETKYQSLEKEIEKCQSEVQILRGTIDTLTLAQSAYDAEEKTLFIELAEALQKTHFEDLAAVEQILATRLDVVVERKKLNDFKNEQLVIQAQLAELNKKLQDRVYNRQNHDALIIDIQEIEKSIQIQNQAIGQLSREIEDMMTRLQKRLETEKVLEMCQHRAYNLNILRGLFVRKGFVDFTSSVFLQSISSAANERFRELTNHQLHLKINENNNFVILDMLNEGKLRDVRTLSGGQTFQASLCLALALSDHIQSRHQARQNFFFLDEGFGSLDDDSLQKVFDALKALQKENRIVGVISHVERMRSEIDRRLNVTLTENAGTRVDLEIG